MKRWDVLCVGIVNLNMVFRPVPMDMMGRDVTLADSLENLCGGDAVNQAVTLSRLGLRAAVAGKIGADAVGEMIRRQLGERGVDASVLATDPEAASGVCIVMVRPDGSRNFLSYRGALERFCPADFELGLAGEARAVSIGSMFALRELDGPGVGEILCRARRLGALTFADTKADTYGIGYQAVRGTIGHLDYFLPSYDEAAAMSGEKDPARMAELFLGDGAGHVVIKLGEQGVYARARGEAGRYFPAWRADVVDTTGAGDNFVAGLIAAVLEGGSFADSIRFASGVAAVSVGSLGAHGGVRSRGQVEEFLVSAKEQ